MKYTEIRQYNVGGNRSIKIPGGPVVIISGDNGAGKTSICEGITLLFEGGHNPDLIGPYDDKAIVEIDFDNGWKFRRETTPKSYKLEGTSEDGTPIRKPAETLKKMLTGFSLNPKGLINAPPKERVKFLQNAMPLEFKPLEIAEALGQDGDVITLPPQSLDAQGFNEFYRGQFDKRTNLNRSIRDKEGTRNTLIGSLPPDETTDWDAEAGALRRKREAISVELADIRAGVEQSLATETASLKDEAQVKIDAIKDQLQKDLDVVRKTADETLTEQMKDPLDRMATVMNEIAVAQERAGAQFRAAGVRESIEKISAEERSLAIQSAKLDRVLEKLDKLKIDKLAGLPIPDVDIRDGQIFYKNLNFDTQLNTAQQWVLSCQVAAQTLGDFPLMILDGAEALGEKMEAEFIEGIKEAGFQVIMAKVRSNEPLAVVSV